MAVENKYVSTDTDVVQFRGGDVRCFAQTFEVAAADDDGSIYRIAKVSGDLVPIKVEINCDAIANATDYDLGLYETLENGGAVKDKDIFMDGTNISAGAAMGSEIDGMTAIPVASIGAKVYELAGDTNATPGMEYDLALTGVTVGTAAGTISVRCTFARTS